MNKFRNKPAGVINASDLRTFKGKLVYFLINVILVVLCLVAILPTIWTLLTSFKSVQEMYSSASLFVKDLSWTIVKERFTNAFAVLDIGRSVFNTIFLSLSGTLFMLVVQGLGGYVLSRLKPRGSALIFALIVWTMMMPSQIRIVPLFMSYQSFPFIADLPGEVNLMNTYWPMIFNGAAGAFGVLLFKNNFDAVSMSYVDAARIDGCGNIRIFFNIMVPLSLPIIIYMTISGLQSAWGDFFTPYLVLTNQKMQTLPVKLFILAIMLLLLLKV